MGCDWIEVQAAAVVCLCASTVGMYMQALGINTRSHGMPAVCSGLPCPTAHACTATQSKSRCWTSVGARNTLGACLLPTRVPFDGPLPVAPDMKRRRWASTRAPTTSGLWRTIGRAPCWGPGAWAGR